MVRRDQQIDASNFVYSIGRKNSALFENYRFKKGTTWFRICQSLKKGGFESHQLGENRGWHL